MINIKDKELDSSMLPYIQNATNNWTDINGEFTAKFNFEVKTHGLTNQT